MRLKERVLKPGAFLLYLTFISFLYWRLRYSVGRDGGRPRGIAHIRRSDGGAALLTQHPEQWYKLGMQDVIGCDDAWRWAWLARQVIALLRMLMASGGDILLSASP